jgi:acyl-CoA thioester hydrolase
MSDVYLHQVEVNEADIDRLGHVNNLVYLRWMIDAALAHSAALGWPTDAYQKLGAGWVVRSHKIRYLQPAFAGQRIVVQTWVATMKRLRSLRCYKIIRLPDETVLASASTEWAFVDYTNGTPKKVPDEVVAAFRVVDEPNDNGLAMAE